MAPNSEKGSFLQPVKDAFAIGVQLPRLSWAVYDHALRSSAKKFSSARDIQDLSEKVVLVTGGNTGLGLETVLRLAEHHPKHIFLAARTASKAEKAIEHVRTVVSNVSISHVSLDLSSFDSIRNCADAVRSQVDQLDILVNNAGVMALPMGLTKEGYEIQTGTNHLGHFLLTRLLLPILEKTAQEPGSDVRIVNVSSEMRLTTTKPIVMDAEVLGTLNTWRRYGTSKQANVLHAKELGRRYPNITVVSLHPGVIFTGLYENFRGWPVIGHVFKAFEKTLAKVIFPSVAQGTMNQLWSATAPSEKIRSGGYYMPLGRLHEAPEKNSDAARILWQWSEAQVERHGF